MIRINKGGDPPKILSKGRGKKEAQSLCDAFDLNSEGYLGVSPPCKHEFKNTIYNAKSVKKKLKQCQHNKCCYSEAKFNGDYGDVEHFRPKGRVGVQNSNQSNYPGYYWLAYSWENLFLCKQVINQSYKMDFFPLENELDRAHDHNRGCALERPTLIDPSLEDPREHIRFHLDEPVGITDRGRKTIALLNLCHPDFEEARRKLLWTLKELRATLDELDPDCEPAINIRRYLSCAVRADAEFSSMAMDFLSDRND